MTSLRKLIPEVDTLLCLQPEELAEPLLKVLVSSKGNVSPSNFLGLMYQHSRSEYPAERRAEVLRAVREAWAWLENEGLIAEEHEPSGPRE